MLSTDRAFKHNHIGEHIWQHGIEYTYHFLSEKWQSTAPAKIGVKNKKGDWTKEGLVQDVTSDTSDLHGFDQELKIGGLFLNLISPLGGHAVDMVSGKTSPRHPQKLFFLEANPSRVRGDQTGMNHFTSNNIFGRYLEWASDHVHRNPNASGPYTKMLFQQLTDKQRASYLEGVHTLWTLANKLMIKNLLACDPVHGLHIGSIAKKLARASA